MPYMDGMGYTNLTHFWRIFAEKEPNQLDLPGVFLSGLFFP